MTPIMMEPAVADKPLRRRYTRPTWVKFGPLQRERLEEIAIERGMALAQVVRQATVVHYDLPRESQDVEED